MVHFVEALSYHLHLIQDLGQRYKSLLKDLEVMTVIQLSTVLILSPLLLPLFPLLWPSFSPSRFFFLSLFPFSRPSLFPFFLYTASFFLSSHPSLSSYTTPLSLHLLIFSVTFSLYYFIVDLLT